ncbi:MAG: ParB/RepB/Spo0J family partition protein [Chloroflexi bacterium]|nr:ParB/RepB/Spo0J family partition protein [Chloroflexota bacterium]OJV92945.1 MAG: hypothetical protein BGO39_03235 [Chloroflexi bacterium 54-19]
MYAEQGPAREPGKFEIVTGERRYWAAQITSLKQVPAIVEIFSDEKARVVSLTENLQRRNLNFKEEVEFLAQLNESRIQAGFGGESDLSRLLHKSRTYIAKRLKIASFPDLIERVNTNQISINHAYTEAVDLEQLQLPFEKEEEDNKETVTGEKMHNVFPGNTFSSKELQLPFSKDVLMEKAQVFSESQPKIYTRSTFKARIVPFSRAKEALKLVEQDLNNFKEEERSQLKQALDELEQELTRFKEFLGS